MPLRRENYRDMEKFRRTRNAQRKRYYNKTSGLYPKRKYTPDEDHEILNSEHTDSELSVLIQRSVRSIQERRYKLKKRQEMEDRRG